MAASKTVAPGVTYKRYGATVPRVYTPPLVEGPPGPCGCGCALTPETSDGFNAVEFATQYLGLTLRPWQRWLLIHMLERHPSGRGYRFRTIIVLVARQNGKSTVSQVLALWWLYVLGVNAVLSAAQDLPTAEKIWDEAVEMAKDNPVLADGMGRPVYTNGKRQFKLIKDRDAGYCGGSWYVKAASRSAGRGFTGNRVMLDELREHQTWDAWGAITKTTMAIEDAQIVGLSNAGDPTAIVLDRLRRLAHEALGDPDGIVADYAATRQLAEEVQTAEFDEDELADLDEFDPDDDELADDLAIFEWSASPGCKLTDRDEWAQANPSLGYGGFTERNIASALKTDPEWVFRTEVLCQWPSGTLKGDGFAGESWSKTQIVEPDPSEFDSEEQREEWVDAQQIVGRVKVTLEMSASRRWVFACLAGWRADGLAQIEVAHRQAGTEWIKSWLMDPERRHLFEMVVGQGRGAPISPTMLELQKAFEDPSDPFDIPVRLLEGPDVSASYARVHDWVRDGKVRHFKQPALDVAAVHARTKRAGDGKMWDRTSSVVDIAPVVGCTEALYVLTEEAERPRQSAYAGRGLLTV